MNPPSAHSPILVVEPAAKAFERMREILFRPFDLGRWFTIGFCAFLATLGDSLGGGGGGYGGSGDGGNTARSVTEYWDKSVSYVSENLVWLVPAAVLSVMVILAIWLLVLWLNCRGRFMFLDNVATNRAEVVRPWRENSRAANNLFLLRLLFILAGLLLVLISGGIAIAVSLPMVREEEANAVGVTVLALTALIAAGLGFGLFIVAKLTKDFVVPLMWRRGLNWISAWSELSGLLAAHPLSFVLYLLFYLLLVIASFLVILVTVVCTCCLAGCLMAIPYLGTVLLLPILVFLRAYSLYFLAQFGPGCDVFHPLPGRTG